VTATVNPANSTRSPSQVLQSTFLLVLLMQIYVDTQALKAVENTLQSSRLIRQEISCSVLKDTVKFNNTNLLTSLFLKKKLKHLKNASSPQLCSESQPYHCILFILCSRSLKAEHFHSWFVRPVKLVSEASAWKSCYSQTIPSITKCRRRDWTLLSTPPEALSH